jgi:hypothetical protein
LAARAGTGMASKTQAILRAWAWRLALDKMHRRGAPPAFRGEGSKRVLVVCHPHRIAATLAYPFFFYRDSFARRHGIDVAFVAQETVEKGAGDACKDADWVLFQTWFDWTNERMDAFARRLREGSPNARLGYLDWFAPTDLRYAEALHPHVARYFKKHLLADLSAYGKPTVGDTNLTDFYNRKHGIAAKTACFAIPDGFLEKVRLAPCFAVGPDFVPGFLGAHPRFGGREFDLHARLTFKGEPWYEAMRMEARGALGALQGGVRVVSKGRVGRRQFMAELRGSKLCFSPFGYGEVCWRDYEAAMTGALLVKPDMAHVRTTPDLFKPFESYVPCRWDYADFAEIVGRYLADSTDRERITCNAFDVVADYLRRETFVEQMAGDLA